MRYRRFGMLFATALLVYYFFVIRIFPAITGLIRSAYNVILSDLRQEKAKGSGEA